MVVIDVHSLHQRHVDLARKLQNHRIKYPEVHHPEHDIHHEPVAYAADYPFKR